MAGSKQGARSTMAAVTQLITRKPRTAGEVAELLGVKAETAAGSLRALVAEGLVAVSLEPRPGSRKRVNVYTWTGGEA